MSSREVAESATLTLMPRATENNKPLKVEGNVNFSVLCISISIEFYPQFISTNNANRNLPLWEIRILVSNSMMQSSNKFIRKVLILIWGSPFLIGTNPQFNVSGTQVGATMKSTPPNAGIIQLNPQWSSERQHKRNDALHNLKGCLWLFIILSPFFISR